MTSTDDLWFTDGRASVRLSNRDNARGLSLIEHTLPQGSSPPLHVHYHEDETFYVLEGRVRYEKGGKAIEANPGDAVHVPAGVQHSFIVLSPIARVLTITCAGFEDMVREASRPAANDGLPEPASPTAAQQQMLAQICLKNGIELTGAPLTSRPVDLVSQ